MFVFVFVWLLILMDTVFGYGVMLNREEVFDLMAAVFGERNVSEQKMVEPV
jgi:hypothetical protein